jgi:hypothetical protein
MKAMDLTFKFVNYGENLEPAAGTLVLDVGMRTVPGVIDHHHPEAEPWCTASLVVRHPSLVLDHIRPSGAGAAALTFVTHRLPDFDALASIFLSLKLIEAGRVDAAMERLAAYANQVDSASLPDSLDLSATPYAVLRALFSGWQKSEDEINRARIEEGLKFMRFLYARAAEGLDIVENRKLFAGIDRYERAVRKVEADYANYLDDLDRGRILRLRLPRPGGQAWLAVDGLAASNPKSFLLKEWARRDREHPMDRQGFGFLMTKFGDNRFILGVNPERGIHLKGLGTLLNDKEKEIRAALGQPEGAPWYEGANAFFDYRIIDSPRDGTSLTLDEVLETVLVFGNGRFFESLKERSRAKT